MANSINIQKNYQADKLVKFKSNYVTAVEFENGYPQQRLFQINLLTNNLPDEYSTIQLIIEKNGNIKTMGYKNGWITLNNLIDTFTITPASDVTLKRKSATKVGNLVAGTIVASASFTNSQWLEIFTYSPTASSTPFKVPAVATSDGTYLGMVEFTDNGKIRLYPKQTKEGEFSFSFAYAVNI